MSNFDSTVTLERLRYALRYEFESGLFYWVEPGKANKRFIGKVAGTATNTGYFKVSVGGQNYLAHRLVFFYVYGRWPVGLLDHIDGNPLNNRIENLRESTDALNTQNRRRARIGNSSGYLGVSVYKGRPRQPNKTTWVAQIQVNGKKKMLGVFDCPKAAHVCYLDAKRLLHEACTI